MRALRAFALLALLFAAAGCVATTGGIESGGYYSRASIHEDSFPPDYNPGRVPGWGSMGAW